MIYRKNPSKYLVDYLEAQGTKLPDGFIREEFETENSSNINDINNVSNIVVEPKNSEIIFE